MDFKIANCSFKIVLWLLMMFGIVSCSQNSVLVDNYVKDAVLLNISAAKDLNYYNDQSHPILLAVYELSDPNDFKQVLADKDKISALLDSSLNSVGIVSQLKITLQPGHNTTVLLDKVEKAKYLGVIAGYFLLGNIDNYARLYEIDIYEEKSIYGSSLGVNKLSIDIELGRGGFEFHGVENSALSERFLEQIALTN